MRPLLAPVLAVAALSAAPLAAQTADQARLVFSVGIGQSSGGGELCSIGRQPFLVSPSRTDTLSLRRSFRRSLNVVLSGTYFPGNHLGYNVEAQMLAFRSGARANNPQMTDVAAKMNDREIKAVSDYIAGLR